MTDKDLLLETKERLETYNNQQTLPDNLQSIIKKINYRLKNDVVFRKGDIVKPKIEKGNFSFNETYEVYSTITTDTNQVIVLQDNSGMFVCENGQDFDLIEDN